MDFETYVFMAILRSLDSVSGTFGHLRRNLFSHFEVPQVSEFASQHCLNNPDQTLTHSIKGACRQVVVQTPGAACGAHSSRRGPSVPAGLIALGF